jgi:oligoendopeptidase F
MSNRSENSKTRILERSEIPEEYTWDLSKLAASDEEWEKSLAALEERIPEIESFKGSLGASAARLKTFLDYMRDTELLDERIGYYAHLRSAEDVGSSIHQERLARYMNAATRLSAALSFVNPEIQAIPREKMEEFLDDPGLREYRIMLEKILRFKPHVLSPEEERLLALQGETRRTPEKTFSALTNVDFQFGDIDTPEGPRPLSQSTFSSFMINPDRGVRKETYSRLYSVYGDHVHTLASLFEGSVQYDVYSARVRKYSNAREMALFPDKVPGEVYDNLIAVVHENLPVLHRYYELRRRLLGLGTLAHWDVYVPVVSEVHTRYTYEEAVETIIEALAPLGEEYCDTLRSGLMGRWVDRYENRGKRSGAFSAGSYAGDPYILMNYQEEVLRDLFTLAHEGGHSMHSWYSVRNNPFQHYNYTIFEAEVASTFNEQLVGRALLREAKDPKMQAYIVNKEVDDIVATIFRQTMFAEFEDISHRMVEQGSPLTVDSIRSAYRGLLELYFGKKVHLPESADIECLRIPHFYNAFYVYKYATGLSASVALAKRVSEGGKEERDHYLSFLKSGGSRYPLESLRLAGVDMTSPEPIRAAMLVFKEKIDRLETLLGL